MSEHACDPEGPRDLSCRACRDDYHRGSPAPAPGSGLREAAQRFVKRLDEVHESDAYRRVWQIAQLHDGPYAGPQYVAELDAIRALLATNPEATPHSRATDDLLYLEVYACPACGYPGDGPTLLEHLKARHPETPHDMPPIGDRIELENAIRSGAVAPPESDPAPSTPPSPPAETALGPTDTEIEIEALRGERDCALARAYDSDAWRHVAAYYLGDFTDTHTPEECRAEAMRRAMTPAPAAPEVDLEEIERAIRTAARSLENWPDVAQRWAAVPSDLRNFWYDESMKLAVDLGSAVAAVRSLVERARREGHEEGRRSGIEEAIWESRRQDKRGGAAPWIEARLRALASAVASADEEET